jgi:TPR repeat protein
MRTLMLALCLGLGSATAVQAAGNFAAGVAAYESKDFAAAMAHWLPLAKSGFAAAQHNVAVMYDHGQGVAANDALAVSWYERAANGGHAPSQHSLGLLYSRGQDVGKSMPKALAWFRKAATQGHSESQFVLGVLFDFGKGVKKNDIEAVKWYRLAAEQGDPRAQYNLALMYDFGQGGLDNPRQAVRWYRRAAQLGNPKAQYMLGVAYLQGDGVSRDNIASYAWMTLAAGAGHVRAKQYRAHPWKGMSASERKQGRKLEVALKRKIRLRRSISTETPGRIALPTVALIKNTQRVLAQRGLLSGPADGVLGPQTRAAIMALQEALGARKTGAPSVELLLLAELD